MALMKTLILALCIGHSAVLELPPRRRARLFSYMWCWVLLGHFPSLRPVVDALGSRDVLFKGWCQSSRAPEARIHSHARHMHGKDRTCDSAAWSSLPVPKSEANEERVLLLVYLLVEVHVVDPSITGFCWVPKARANINAVPANRNPFQDFYMFFGCMGCSQLDQCQAQP